jgi:hypothetical protein
MEEPQWMAGLRSDLGDYEHDFVMDADSILRLVLPHIKAAYSRGRGKMELSESECTMLTYALDLAQERIWAEKDEFTDGDQAAVDSLRRLAAEGCGCTWV